MSDYVFPSFPGLKPEVTVTPVFDSKVIESLSGAETVISNRAYPRYEFELGYEVLRSGASFVERQKLQAFFSRHRGRGESFIFVHEEDNAVADEQFGTTDGTTTTFQLTRTASFDAGTWKEPVFVVTGTPTIKKAGTTLTPGVHYTLGTSGQVILAAAGTGGQALTWTGGFGYRVRFKEDSIGFERFLSGLWKTGRVSLISKVYP